MNMDVAISTELQEILAARRDEIIADACEALRRAHLCHYEAAGPEECSERLARLLDLVLESVKEQTLLPVIRHAERVAWLRFEAGFEFREVHTAFNVLEEAIWHQVVALSPREDVADLLSLTGTIFGAAKESLAAEYVSLAAKQSKLSLNLTRLFEGVEGAD